MNQIFFTLMLCTLLFNLKQGRCMYFPLSQMELSWHDTRTNIKSKFEPVSLLTVRAATDDETSEMKGPLRYTLEESTMKTHALRLDPENGRLWMSNNTKVIPKNIIISASYGGGKPLARVSVALNRKNYLGSNCDPQTLCFWDSVRYTIMEGPGNKPVGPLSPELHKQLCPNATLTYRLLNGTNYMTIRGSTLWRTNSTWDHDTSEPGPVLNIRVSCEVKGLSKPKTSRNKVISIHALDRPDSSPIPQHEQIIVNLTSAKVEKGNTVPDLGGLIFNDNDSHQSAGGYQYEIVDDDLGILKLGPCMEFEDSRSIPPHTTIHCGMIFAKSDVVRPLPYCVTLVVTDLLLQKGLGDPKGRTRVCLNVHTNMSDTPIALPIKQKEKPNQISNVLSKVKYIISYNKTAHIYKGASKYARVAQPNQDMALLMKQNDVSFRLKHLSPIFGITFYGGIIYVQKPEALTTNKYNITIIWSDGKDEENVSIVVNVFDESKTREPTCLKNKLQFCAQHGSRKKCQNSCGFGTGGSSNNSNGYCEWREPTSHKPTLLYGTCSPALNKCPDQICDPLEKLESLICPQDCVDRSQVISLGLGSTWETDSQALGIPPSPGVCTCTTITCACHAPQTQPHNKGFIHSCGSKCQILALCGSSLIVLACVVAIWYCIRRKLRRKREMRSKTIKKCDIGEPTLTISRADEDEVFLINAGADADSRNDDEIKKNDSDPKWELPRACLRLESALGEGEFGRVLRATAKNIDGKDGDTTVAVKTLKPGARAADLLALLSEFSLLQEVDHPNVVKLLGACTVADPPLVVIEYAKHGSLRSYLRRSRLVDLSTSGSQPYLQPMSQITVREVLSFAWQTCKGMTYLAEIKLVHRDLAARNVLLAEGKICKISDFGLTRDVYEDDAYLKRSRGRVPVKWMAPESLSDHVYTSRSDVWSFGILTWELITLGRTPYPGVQPEHLYHLLQQGYRMRKPDNCSQQIYSIMNSCWAEDPNSRPSFKILTSRWEELMAREGEYIDSVNRSAVANPTYYCEELEIAPLPASANLDYLPHLWSTPDPTVDTNENTEDDITNEFENRDRTKYSSTINVNAIDKISPEQNCASNKIVNTMNITADENDKLNNMGNITNKRLADKVIRWEVPCGYSVPKHFANCNGRRASYANEWNVMIDNNGIKTTAVACQMRLPHNGYVTPKMPARRALSYVDMRSRSESECSESPYDTMLKDFDNAKIFSNAKIKGRGPGGML